MNMYKFKVEDYINSPQFISIKGENQFEAINIARQIFCSDKYKITFIEYENNTKFS